MDLDIGVTGFRFGSTEGKFAGRVWPGAGHRQMLFAKMRARVAVLVAKSAAVLFMRFD